MSSPEKTVEAKIELLVNVATLTIMTLMRLIKAKGPDAIGEPEIEQFNKVRESIQTAIGAVEAWSEQVDSEGNPVDLTHMRAKLDMLVRKLDEWPLDQTTTDSTPPPS